MSNKYSDIFISNSEPSLPGIKFYFNSSTNKLFYKDFEENSWEEVTGISLSQAQNLIDLHNSDTQSVHGIADTSSLATNSSLSSAISELSSIYLTQTDASLTYLSQSSASSTYLTQASASSLYLSKTDASSTYLSQASASSTYLTQSSASSTYLTQTNASSIYLSQSDASSNYLTQSSASSTYLTQASASSTYLTQSNAASTYDTAEQVMVIAISDETSNITTGTNKLTMRAPFSMTLTKIPRASVNTVSSSGNPTVDINVGGTSILGANKLSIDVNEKTSTTAATATTLETSSITDDAEITFDIDVAGTGAKGLKIALYYKKA